MTSPHGMSHRQIVRLLQRQHGFPLDVAIAAADRQAAPGRPARPTPRPAVLPTAEARWHRYEHQLGGLALDLMLPFAPRTKKNHGRAFGIKQSAAYVAYREAIITALEPARLAYGTPLLPDAPYNIAATYYVDRPGEQADKVGLDQGLYDALENAGVVSDDWWFRRADWTRVVPGAEHAHVAILITPIGTTAP